MSLDIIVQSDNVKDKGKEESSPIASSSSSKTINYEAIVAAKPPPPIEIFRCLKHNNDLYHDIFISYRVNTEKKIADKLALLLDSCKKDDDSKVRTFLDSQCLVDGGNWEKNFLSALHHSKLIVLILSEAGLDLPSASDATMTKIQRADHEQDNCLLEYEYTVRLKEEHKAQVFLLLVPKETVLGGTRCTVKFPTSKEGIERRLALYAETGKHKHRDGTQGPLVQETMRKLLGIIHDGDLSYAHLDPDDLGGRIPELLWKLHELEKKQTKWEKLQMIIRDIGTSYIRTLGIGFLIGLIFPVVSLCCTFEAKSTRSRALRVGIIVAHGVDLLGTSALCFWEVWRTETCKDGCDPNDSNAYMFLGIIFLILSLICFGVVFWLRIRGATKSAARYRVI